jgi:hypothetical protein
MLQTLTLSLMNFVNKMSSIVCGDRHQKQEVTDNRQEMAR